MALSHGICRDRRITRSIDDASLGFFEFAVVANEITGSLLYVLPFIGMLVSLSTLPLVFVCAAAIALTRWRSTLREYRPCLEQRSVQSQDQCCTYEHPDLPFCVRDPFENTTT